MTRPTSSSVVMPAATLARPSSQSVRIPCSMAFASTSSRVARLTAILHQGVKLFPLRVRQVQLMDHPHDARRSSRAASSARPPGPAPSRPAQGAPGEGRGQR